MKYCRLCGMQLDDDFPFCNFCGTAVNKDLSEQPPETAPLDNKNNSAVQPLKNNKKTAEKTLLYKFSSISLFTGIIGFILIAAVSLIVYGKIYLYNGYEITKIFCSICLIFMIGGILMDFAETIILKKQKVDKITLKEMRISRIFIILAVIFSIILIISASNYNHRKHNNRSSSSSEIPTDLYAVACLDVTYLNASGSAGSGEVFGTICNNGTRAVKNVKVNVQCTYPVNRTINHGNYIIVSETLKPGESKRFSIKFKGACGVINSKKVTVLDCTFV